MGSDKRDVSYRKLKDYRAGAFHKLAVPEIRPVTSWRMYSQACTLGFGLSREVIRASCRHMMIRRGAGQVMVSLGLFARNFSRHRETLAKVCSALLVQLETTCDGFETENASAN